MKRLYLLLLLVLTACTATPVASDPYARLNLAEQVARDAEAAIQATARHLEAEYQLTTGKQTQLAAEVYATAAALEHEATKISLQETAQAPVLAQQGTQLAIYHLATQSALEATPLSATAAALAVAVQREQAMGYIFPGSVAILTLLIGGALAWSIISLSEWRIERERLAASRADGLYGPMVYDYDSGVWHLLTTNDKYRSLPRSQPQEVKVSPGEVTAIGPVRTDPEPLVREFLEAAARVNGVDSSVIPSWRDLTGWTSDRWQRAVHLLKSAQVVSARPGVGTYVIEGDIGGILYQLDVGELELSPLPRYNA